MLGVLWIAVLPPTCERCHPLRCMGGLQVIGSALAVASGLVMGKVGPMLHAGSFLAGVVGN